MSPTNESAMTFGVILNALSTAGLSEKSLSQESRSGV
jgi:hypothetical protein